MIERVKSRRGIFECPRKGECSEDCHRCDIGMKFSDLRKVIFKYNDEVKKLKHELELDRHPSLKKVNGENRLRKFPKGATGKQCEFIFIDEVPAEKALDEYKENRK